MNLYDLFSILIAFLALAFTAFTFIKNQKFLKKQQFESTFFNMMKQLEDIVSKLSLDKVIGRDVFKYFFNDCPVYIIDNPAFEKIYELENDQNNIMLISNIKIDLTFQNGNDTNSEIISSKGVENIINNLGIIGYENIHNIHIIDHYFRYLYRIIRFVDEATFLDNNTDYIDKRYYYMGILRATLSPSELVFLFYNGLSKYGYEKVKPLIEKYSLLKNIREDLTANFTNQIELEKGEETDFYSLKDDKINDGLKYDYYRFQTDVKGDKTKYYWSAFEKDEKLFKDKSQFEKK